jgi:hypothetical protein
MSRYALIEVHDLREAGPLHLPRFRGTFEEIADALSAVRSDVRGEGTIVATDPETGAIEEWSREDGGSVAIPMAEVLAETPMIFPETFSRGSYRVFHVSPRGRRFATSFYIHDTVFP